MCKVCEFFDYLFVDLFFEFYDMVFDFFQRCLFLGVEFRIICVNIDVFVVV